MKKTLFTFSALASFLLFLVLPLILGLHASMGHHDMNASNCIKHCISIEIWSEKDKIRPSTLEFPEIHNKNTLSHTLSASSPRPSPPLSLVRIYPPPDSHVKIRNYDYASLVGVIKLTT